MAGQVPEGKDPAVVDAQLVKKRGVGHTVSAIGAFGGSRCVLSCGMSEMSAAI